jgi:hypothetical protein
MLEKKIKRKEHLLRKLKRVSFPKHWVFFDTETKIVEENNELQKQKLRLGIAWFVRLDREKIPYERCIFYNPKEFYDFLRNHAYNKQTLYVASLNIAFDLASSEVLKFFLKANWEIVSWSVTNTCEFLKLKKGERRIIFIDLLNYFKASVKELGELLGIPKIELNPLEASEEELIPYCERDVEIITFATLEFINYLKENKLGSLGISASSTAFKVFRTKFLDRRVKIHNDEKVLELERKAYFGGRTECFRLGAVKGKVYILDVNSMYPFVMRYNKFPCVLTEFKEKGTPKEVEELIKMGFLVIAHCYVSTDEPVYPYRTDEHLIFPVGKFHTYLCTPSLKYAIEQGHLKRVYEYAIYVGDYIFSDYIDYFYNERLRFKREGNQVYAYICKLFMNSLYGKFAQRVRRIEKFEDALVMPNKTFVYDEDGNYIGFAVKFLNQGFIVVNEYDESYNSFPAISAHVTDYARMYLWTLIKRAGIENVFYVDTDSLHVNDKGYIRLMELVNDEELGMLKLEDVVKSAKYYAPKFYEAGARIKRKGISSKAVQVGDFRFSQLQFPSLRTILYQLPDGVPIKKVLKELKLEYEKGIVKPDGRVKPFKLHEKP